MGKSESEEDEKVEVREEKERTMGATMISHMCQL